jgi:hypothetical protein
MAFSSATPGLIPHPKKGVALNDNYIQFTDSSSSSDFSDFSKQYLPELYEAEVERYGNRTIGGFLRMVGAEMPMSSDQVIWSEQNRLHIAYEDCLTTAASNDITIVLKAGDEENMAIKEGNLVVVKGIAAEDEEVAIVTGVSRTNATTFVVTVAPYTVATIDAKVGAGECSLFVFGSEYVKGAGTGSTNAGPDAADTLTPNFQQYNNKPIIIRDNFRVNGSDAAQIGWVEVATEDGTSGYLWYLKAESETRLRFEDYLEMTMVESKKKTATGAAGALDGTEGLFAAIKDRGNVMAGFPTATAAGAGALVDFDEILKELDRQGAIEENMLFVNREMALNMDDMLANVGADTLGGTGFGLFDNDSDMALNLGFSGFRRGSYDFYKTDWKYLNDPASRGVRNYTGTAYVDGFNIEGVLVPAGTSTVYDQILGQNIRRPFLHVRYRASETEDRRMKTWVTGSVGSGTYTSDLDAMTVNFLSERCLCVQGANNFVLFTS